MGIDRKSISGMEPLTATQIEQSFSRKDRKRVVLPNLAGIEWGEIDFLSWRHRDGSKFFVVHNVLDEELHGLILTPSNFIGGTVRQCDWCETTNSGYKVSLFTATYVSNPNIKVSKSMCSDLDCSDYVRGKKFPSIATVTPRIGVENRIARLKENLDNYFLQIL